LNLSRVFVLTTASTCSASEAIINSLQGVNAKSFGDYPDGFTPENTVATQGVLLPGCSVADDFAHALGDPAEGQLASALSYRTNGVCPLPPSSVQPPSPLPAQSIKSFWRQNRIYRPPASRRTID
jgi:hypothetical protein